MMKKVIVWAVVLFVFSTVASAQLRFGAVAGATGSGFVTKSTVATDLSPQVNFKLGAAMQYDFWIFTLQPELVFNRIGGKINDANDKYYLQQYAGLSEASPELSYTMNQLELPVKLMYKLNLKKYKLFVEGGPYVALNLGGNFNGKTDTYKAYDKAFSFKTLDYGLGAGAGVEIGKFQIGGHWDWGMNPLGSKTTLSTGSGNVNVFNVMKVRTLSLTMGVFF